MARRWELVFEDTAPQSSIMTALASEISPGLHQCFNPASMQQTPAIFTSGLRKSGTMNIWPVQRQSMVAAWSDSSPTGIGPAKVKSQTSSTGAWQSDIAGSRARAVLSAVHRDQSEAWPPTKELLAHGGCAQIAISHVDDGSFDGPHAGKGRGRPHKTRLIGIAHIQR